MHDVPEDLRETLVQAGAGSMWESLTVLGRNEFICWVEDAKQEKTRLRRITRTVEQILGGERRPCCWPGCSHRERTGHA